MVPPVRMFRTHRSSFKSPLLPSNTCSFMPQSSFNSVLVVASLLCNGGVQGMSMSSSAGVEKGGKFIQLDGFAKRQWDPTYKGLVVTSMTQEALEAKVNELYWEKEELVDGYAPFCKHIFVPNFLEGARAEAAPITEQNKHLLLSGYEARKPEELPVLSRWFPKDKVEAPLATHLDLILYSRDQINKETAAMGREVPAGEAPPWGLISIKAQLVDSEIPMQPITMMRNALGKKEGGSGVPMERAKYDASVEYWSKHATIA